MVSCCLAWQNYLGRPVGGVKELKLPSHSPACNHSERANVCGAMDCVSVAVRHTWCVQGPLGEPGQLSCGGGGQRFGKSPFHTELFEQLQARLVVVVGGTVRCESQGLNV